MNVAIFVPPGELADKITILEIKSRRVKDTKKLASVKKELGLLKISLAELLKENKNKKIRLSTLKKKLYGINAKLWDIEDEIRKLELKKDFGEKFIRLARSVYITNDERSKAKSAINTLFGSQLNEVKQYVKYK
jgi:septal ring factor EnvC (AmiA/AmiB activator)